MTNLLIELTRRSDMKFLVNASRIVYVFPIPASYYTDVRVDLGSGLVDIETVIESPETIAKLVRGEQ